MMRGVLCGFVVLLVSAVGAANVRYCTGDLIVMDMTELTGKWPHKRSELSAKLRVSLRPDRRVKRIVVEQSSGYRELDNFLVKHFSEWQFLKAKNCDVVFIPIWMTVKREKT
jgi:hypothetical protein